jgi:hypothetical protein
MTKEIAAKDIDGLVILLSVETSNGWKLLYREFRNGLFVATLARC